MESKSVVVVLETVEELSSIQSDNSKYPTGYRIVYCVYNCSAVY